MNEQKTKRIITGLVIFGISAIIAILLFHEWILAVFIGLAYNAFTKPPEQTICIGVQDQYSCITDQAIKDKNPAYCWYLDAGSSDRCSDEVLQAVPDPSLCKKIPEWGVRRDCLNSFKH